jgi:hypothetical protein
VGKLSFPTAPRPGVTAEDLIYRPSEADEKAGVDLSAGMFVAPTSAGHQPADPNSDTDYLPAGLTLKPAKAGKEFDLVTSGHVLEYTGVEPGKLYYLDLTTPGAITDVKPATSGKRVVLAGQGLSVGKLLIRIQDLGLNA